MGGSNSLESPPPDYVALWLARHNAYMRSLDCFHLEILPSEALMAAAYHRFLMFNTLVARQSPNAYRFYGIVPEPNSEADAFMRLRVPAWSIALVPELIFAPLGPRLVAALASCFFPEGRDGPAGAPAAAGMSGRARGRSRSGSGSPAVAPRGSGAFGPAVAAGSSVYAVEGMRSDSFHRRESNVSNNQDQQQQQQQQQQSEAGQGHDHPPLSGRSRRRSSALAPAGSLAGPPLPSATPLQAHHPLSAQQGGQQRQRQSSFSVCSPLALSPPGSGLISSGSASAFALPLPPSSPAIAAAHWPPPPTRFLLSFPPRPQAALAAARDSPPSEAVARVPALLRARSYDFLDFLRLLWVLQPEAQPGGKAWAAMRAYDFDEDGVLGSGDVQALLLAAMGGHAPAEKLPALAARVLDEADGEGAGVLGQGVLGGGRGERLLVGLNEFVGAFTSPFVGAKEASAFVPKEEDLEGHPALVGASAGAAAGVVPVA